jgi:hypothetical protein
LLGGPSQSLSFRDAFFDESSHVDHRFLVIGTITLPQLQTAGFEQHLMARRLPELANPASEMKWQKVSRAKLSAYMRVVDSFFAGSEFRAGVHFHALIVDTTQQRHRAFNHGDREVGFSKEIYQLSLKLGRLYRRELFHLYLDHRDTSQQPEKVRTMLNFGLTNKGDTRDWPYRRMQFRKSHLTPIIQLTDVLTGAIAFKLNGHYDQANASPPKKLLCEHILRLANIRDVYRDTSVGGKFTLWHRRLRVASPDPRP